MAPSWAAGTFQRRRRDAKGLIRAKRREIRAEQIRAAAGHPVRNEFSRSGRIQPILDRKEGGSLGEQETAISLLARKIEAREEPVHPIMLRRRTRAQGGARAHLPNTLSKTVSTCFR